MFSIIKLYNIFCNEFSDEELDRVKNVVEDYRAGKETSLSDDEIWVDHIEYLLLPIPSNRLANFP